MHNKELEKENKKTTDPTYEESENIIYKTLVKIIVRKTVTISGKPQTPDSIKHLVTAKKEQKRSSLTPNAE